MVMLWSFGTLHVFFFFAFAYDYRLPTRCAIKIGLRELPHIHVGMQYLFSYFVFSVLFFSCCRYLFLYIYIFFLSSTPTCSTEMLLVVLPMVSPRTRVPCASIWLALPESGNKMMATHRRRVRNGYWITCNFFYRIEYHNAYSGRQQKQQLPTIDSRLPNHTLF